MSYRLIYLSIFFFLHFVAEAKEHQCTERAKTSCPANNETCSTTNGGTCKTDAECQCPQHCCIVKCKHTCIAGVAHHAAPAAPIAHNTSSAVPVADNASSTASPPAHNASSATPVAHNVNAVNDTKASTNSTNNTAHAEPRSHAELKHTHNNASESSKRNKTEKAKSTPSTVPKETSETNLTTPAPHVTVKPVASTSIPETVAASNNQTSAVEPRTAAVNNTPIATADSKNVSTLSSNETKPTESVTQLPTESKAATDSVPANESDTIIPRSFSGLHGLAGPKNTFVVGDDGDMENGDNEALDDSNPMDGLAEEEISAKDQLLENDESTPEVSAKKKERNRKRQKPSPVKDDEPAPKEIQSKKDEKPKKTKEPLAPEEKELMKRLRLKMRRTQHAQAFEHTDEPTAKKADKDTTDEEPKEKNMSQKSGKKTSEASEKQKTANKSKKEMERGETEENDDTQNKNKKDRTDIDAQEYEEEEEDKRQKKIRKETTEETLNKKTRKRKKISNPKSKSADDDDDDESETKPKTKKVKGSKTENKDSDDEDGYIVDTLSADDAEHGKMKEDDLSEKVQTKELGKHGLAANKQQKSKPVNEDSDSEKGSKQKQSTKESNQESNRPKESKQHSDLTDGDKTSGGAEETEPEGSFMKSKNKFPSKSSIFPDFSEKKEPGTYSENEKLDVPKTLSFQRGAQPFGFIKPLKTKKPSEEVPVENDIMKHRDLILQMIDQVPLLLQKSIYRDKTVPPMVVKLPNGEYIYAPPKPGYDARPIEPEEQEESLKKEEGAAAGRIPFTTSWNKFLLNAKPFGPKAPGNYPYPIVMTLTKPDDIFNLYPEQGLPSFSQFYSQLDLPFYINKGFQKNRTETDDSTPSIIGD